MEAIQFALLLIIKAHDLLRQNVCYHRHSADYQLASNNDLVVQQKESRLSSEPVDRASLPISLCKHVLNRAEN